MGPLGRKDGNAPRGTGERGEELRGLRGWVTGREEVWDLRKRGEGSSH